MRSIHPVRRLSNLSVESALCAKERARMSVVRADLGEDQKNETVGMMATGRRRRVGRRTVRRGLSERC